VVSRACDAALRTGPHSFVSSLSDSRGLERRDNGPAECWCFVGSGSLACDTCMGGQSVVGLVRRVGVANAVALIATAFVGIRQYRVRAMRFREPS
jgi:hypothetical protein